MKDILIFATGADCIPPLGFTTQPVLTFLHGQEKYPLANTYALQLKIPTIHKMYADFKIHMDFGIGDAKDCFGFA